MGFGHQRRPGALPGALEHLLVIFFKKTALFKFFPIGQEFLFVEDIYDQEQQKRPKQEKNYLQNHPYFHVKPPSVLYS
jgi:hypothetical protein